MSPEKDAMASNDVDWEVIRESLKKTFGKDFLKRTESERVATIAAESAVLAVLNDRSTPEAPKTLGVSLRASLLPNDAGLIIGALVPVASVIILNNFDFDAGGRFLSGDEAIRNMWGERPRSILDTVFERFLEKQYSLPN